MSGFSPWEVGLVLGVLMFGYLILKELIGLATRYFFKRGFTTDYVTTAKCDDLRSQCELKRGGCQTEAQKDSALLREAVLMLLKYSKDVPEKVKDGFMKDMVK